MLHSGEVLGQYNVGSLIGQGGFGLVYRGEHSELGIEVAIKEYFPSELSVREAGTVQPSKPEFSEPFAEGLERFLNEAKKLERFRESPSIVTCRDFFRANGTAYMIMDYVAGLSLASLLEQRESDGNPCTERDLLDTIQSLLTGLQTVHESGVYHRDIKPSNILIRQGDGTPVLIDFGAAKQETGKHTKSLAPYTDGYASMEQIGDGKIGSWTDIYGIGAVMWRMVAGGAPPFSPPNPVPVQKRALAFSQEESDPLPTARELGKGRFSDGILHVIDDCLIINPQKRIQDCTELSARLGAGSVVLVEGIDQAVPVEETAETLREENIRSEESESTSRERQNKRSLVALIFTILGLHRLAAEQGDAWAQFNLGNAYYNGKGVPQDYKEAVKWFRLAAEQGNAWAQYNLALMYYNGEGVPQNYQEAMKWYRLATEQEHAEAQHNLALMYYNGKGVPQNYQEAVKWFRLAAEQGLASAQHNMGFMYANGEGIPQNSKEAVKWYRLAAKQGEAGSQLNLALMYDNGEGVPQDYEEAVKWYRLAAKQGEAEAQHNLALMYYNGEGVPQDYVRAHAWASIAAITRDSDSQSQRKLAILVVSFVEILCSLFSRDSQKG